LQGQNEGISEKINDLETKKQEQNIRDLHRGINQFQNGYEHRTNLLKDNNGDLLVDSDNIFNS
jgi:hypothetical protein